MAVKKNFNDGKYNWDDVFDTQDALDSGILGSTTAGTYETTISRQSDFFGIGDSSSTRRGENQVNKDDFGTMVNINGTQGSTGILAYKARKKEQASEKAQGKGVSQSILGGTVV